MVVEGAKNPLSEWEILQLQTSQQKKQLDELEFFRLVIKNGRAVLGA
jgi:hypothetical protein